MRKPYPLETREHVLSLRRQNLAYRTEDIAADTGIPSRTVARWCELAGLSWQPLVQKDIPCEECGKPSRAKNLCLKHYMEMWNGGSFDVEYHRNAILRFMRKVSSDDPYHWLWTGAKNTSPWGLEYGLFHAMGEKVAHRAAYRLFVGDIPEGFQVDHLCSVSLCVWPPHLDPVPQQENIRRTWERGRGQVHSKMNSLNTLEYWEWVTAA